jgi:hypothetical protein
MYKTKEKLEEISTPTHLDTVSSLESGIFQKTSDARR